MSSPQNPLRLSSCYCYGYRFWGGLLLSRVLQKSEYSKQARKYRGVVCWCQVLRQQLILLSFCINVLSCSFHVAFISCHVPFICMHLPFILHSFPFIFLSFVFIFLIFLSGSFRVHSNVHACPFIFLSFCIHFLSFRF